MVLIADNQIYDQIPVKKEVKASVSGLFISDVRGLRGPLEKPEKRNAVSSQNLLVRNKSDKQVSLHHKKEKRRA